jgi:hypothetical protein
MLKLFALAKDPNVGVRASAVLLLGRMSESCPPDTYENLISVLTEALSDVPILKEALKAIRQVCGPLDDGNCSQIEIT